MKLFSFILPLFMFQSFNEFIIAKIATNKLCINLLSLGMTGRKPVRHYSVRKVTPVMILQSGLRSCVTSYTQQRMRVPWKKSLNYGPKVSEWARIFVKFAFQFGEKRSRGQF